MSQTIRQFIAIVEDNEGRIAAMQGCLQEFFAKWSPVFFNNAPDAIAWLSEHLPECALISLDRDLGGSYQRDGELFDPGTGREVADYLAAAKAQCPIVIHSSNFQEGVGMEMALGTSDRLFERVIPFRDVAWVRNSWVKTLKLLLEPIPNSDLTESHLPAADASWESICEFALSFDAVGAWGQLEKAVFLGRQNARIYQSRGIFPDTLTELRTCLWFQRSYWRRYGAEPDEPAMIYILALLDRIREKVRQGELDSGEKPSETQPLQLPDSKKSTDTCLSDRIRGVIYGQAIGDALGLGAEGLLKSQVSEYYPSGLQRYSQIVRDRHRSCWVCGDWTDDTDMMLCILDSLLEYDRLNLWDIAIRFYQWAAAGNPGIGYSTHSVLFSSYTSSVNFFQPDFDKNYYAAAKDFWEKSDRQSAPNGGVMRTAVLGIWEYPYRDRVKSNAEKVCQLTHYDPRCVGSSAAVSLALSALLRGETDIEKIIREIAAEVAEYHPAVVEYLERSTNPSLEALELGAEKAMGYTLKTMSAGFWALQHAKSYADAIQQIIHEGGDADTNAAVAGAIAGALFGYESIPKQWVEELAYKAELEFRVEKLVQIAQKWEG